MKPGREKNGIAEAQAQLTRLEWQQEQLDAARASLFLLATEYPG